MSWQFLLITIIFSVSNLFNICSGALEILEPLEDQYGLIGSNVMVTCKTSGTGAFWVLNGTSITVSHPNTKDDYENFGVVFSYTESDGYYNLTMIVPAILPMNNTSIVCTTRNSMNGAPKSSNLVYFIVFDNFRPYPPLVNVDVYYSPTSLPMILASIHGLPRWPGYEMSEYTVNVTISSKNSLLHHATVLNNLENNTALFNWTLEKPIAEECSTLRISVSAVSDAHGEGELAQIDVQLLKAVKELVNDQLKCTLLFYSNGTVSQLLIQIRLPDVCSYQQVNYTIIVEEEEDDTQSALNVLLNGPHYHQGPGTVSHQILDGLENDRVYSARIQVNHITGITESTKHFFDTKLHSGIPCNSSIISSKGTDNSSFKLVMGVSIGTVVLLLMALLVAFTCSFVYTQRFRKKPQSECSANNRAMIHNPLYDGNGPMYESILGDMVQCRQTADPMTTPTTDRREREARQSGRYVGEPSQLLISQNQQRRPTLQSDTYDHLANHKGSGIEAATQSNAEMEEPYTFMSPAGTLTANSNN